jgi:2,4-dienoyl-CoA reductase-like NADH-dependent reductase (Old Yellow Enzyme family)
MLEQLLSPGRLGKLRPKNKLVRSATYVGRAGPDGCVTPRLLDFYRDLSAGGAGTIITGVCTVSGSAKIGPAEIGAYSDHHIDGLARLADAIHSGDAIAILQLNHCGRQYFPQDDHPPALAPSAVTDPGFGITPREMTQADILSAVGDFAAAASRAKLAAFDAVQLHCAHGYLLSSFLSPYTNRRRDDYGGSLENRTRIHREIIEGIRSACGPEFPVLVKMNGRDFLEGGVDIAEGCEIARVFEQAGVAAIEVSGGMWEAGRKTSQTRITNPEREAYFREEAKTVKQSVSIPVIEVGGVRSPEIAGEILASGDADFVSMSRPLVSEPDLPNKWAAGDRKRTDCVSCNRCLDAITKGEELRCVYKERQEAKRDAHQA